MSRHIARIVIAAASGAVLSMPGVTGVEASRAPSRSAQPQGSSAQPTRLVAGPGTQLWAKRYNGPGNGPDAAVSVAGVSGGRKVFVTGTSDGGPASGLDYATIAYRASTGARLWAARYNGPSSGDDMANATAVSPDESKVFVTGRVRGVRLGEEDYATLAYRASTGARLWARVYRGPVHAGNVAYSVAVSPSGNEVFVTGVSEGAASDGDYATVAYRAGTGARLWVRRYNGPGNGNDVPFAVAVSRAGSKVFVTGRSQGVRSGYDYATIAYRADTGARLWVRRYNGPGNGTDIATATTVNSAANKLIVTGYSEGVGSGQDYATIAYRADSGARLWVRRYNGPGNGTDIATATTVNSAANKVIVTGYSKGVGSGQDYATIAYRADIGARLWVRRYNGPGNGTDSAFSLAVNGAGTKVYVTGASEGGAATGLDYATVAYRATTGARLWAERYNGPGNRTDGATSLTVKPVGAEVVVTGGSYGGSSSADDYATVTYSR